MKNKNKLKNTSSEISGWLFNTPYLIYSLVFFLIPLFWAFWLTTFDWNLMSPTKTFVGLDNFKALFSDPKVNAAFFNSIRYLIYIVPITIVCAFIIAIITYNLPNKIKGFVAVMYFIPYLTSGVAVAVVVKYFLGYSSIFNVFMREQFNIDKSWLQDEFWAFWIIVILVVWKVSGYFALFILSGLESISSDVHEAAAIDGSINLHKFFHITLPMIIPTTTTVIVLASGLAFGIFTEPYLLTGGGPSYTTTSWLIEIYNTSFVRFQSGYGAAMAIACAVQIFITIKLITIVCEKANNKFGA